MKTENQNYKKNISILKENLKRGLTIDQAVSIINNMQDQFINAGLYNSNEKQYINDMRALLIDNAIHINVVNN